jgi:hypothetical protein
MFSAKKQIFQSGGMKKLLCRKTGLQTLKVGSLHKCYAA